VRSCQRCYLQVVMSWKHAYLLVQARQVCGGEQVVFKRPLLVQPRRGDGWAVALPVGACASAARGKTQCRCETADDRASYRMPRQLSLVSAVVR
jgi:hypothetical protein